MYITAKLDELRKRVLTMADLVNRALVNALKAFLRGDWELAELVLHGDEEINALECELDRYALELLALTQPMAGDLRLIVGSMRIFIQLERIGDEAVNIAQRTVSLSMKPQLPMAPNMGALAEMCRAMVSDSILAYADSDAYLAETICARENEVNALYSRILTRLISDMIEESRIVERGVLHIMAAKHLERVADLSANIAESLVFIVKGEDIKHRCID
jgi:phosphate transport system protein